jgi:hypothetical protein
MNNLFGITDYNNNYNNNNIIKIDNIIDNTKIEKLIKKLNTELVFSEDTKSLLNNNAFYGESGTFQICNKKKYNARSWIGKSKITTLLKEIRMNVQDKTNNIFNFVSISKYKNKENKLLQSECDNDIENSDIAMLLFGNSRYIRFERDKRDYIVNLENGYMIIIKNFTNKQCTGFIEENKKNINYENTYVMIFRNVIIEE